MSNTARKARKRAGIKFTKAAKVPTDLLGYGSRAVAQAAEGLNDALSRLGSAAGVPAAELDTFVAAVKSFNRPCPTCAQDGDHPCVTRSGAPAKKPHANRS